MSLSPTPIPSWDATSGLIPPTVPGTHQESPYEATIMDLVSRFGRSDKRRDLLRRLLRFRAELRGIGIVSGFQWINGSFTENIEVIDRRNPGDIDVVTFYHIPNGYTQTTIHEKRPSLFVNKEIRYRHHLDAFFVALNDTTPEHIVNASAYWYSKWSHTDRHVWKGFVQIDLDSSEDSQANDQLASRRRQGAML